MLLGEAVHLGHAPVYISNSVLHGRALHFRLDAMGCEAPGPKGLGSAAIISANPSGMINQGRSAETIDHDGGQ